MRTRSRRSKVVALVVALLGALVVTGVLVRTKAPAPESGGTEELRAPADLVPEPWERALGGDLSQDVLDAITAAPATVDADLAALAADTAVKVATAESTKSNQAAWPTYFGPNAPPAAGATEQAGCSVTGTLATALEAVQTDEATPAAEYLQVLVVLAGTCPTGQLPAQVVLLRNDPTGWTPVRSLGDDARPQGVPRGTPQPWELGVPGTCDNPGRVQVRVELAAVLDVLCADAANAGVTITLTSGLRTGAEQRELFDAAVDELGSEAAARRRVAFVEPDGSGCASRHCAGEAVDVDDTPSAKRWLFEVVGCLDADGFRDATECTDTQSPVTRLERYGLVAPLPSQPHHLEPGLPLPLLAADSPYACAPAPALSAPQVVFSVFACRAALAGMPPDDANAFAAEAVVVARACSGWNPAQVAYAGRYRSTPNPDTGRLHDETGLFALDAPSAQRYLADPSLVTDAASNATAAATIALEARGAGRAPFDPFVCAAAAVPSSGGPPLPAWANLAG